MTSGQRVPHEGRTLSVEFRSTAAAESIFAAFMEADAIESWMAVEAEAISGGVSLRGLDGRWREWHLLDAMSPHFAIYRTERGLLEIRIQPQEERTLVQIRESGFVLGDEGDEEMAAEQSRWQIALGQLRFVLTKSLSAPVMRVRSRRQVPGQIPGIFAYFVYPQWRSEWLAAGIELDQNLVSTRREALFTWPSVRGTLTMSTERIDPQSTWVSLDARAWDALRMPPAVMVELFEESLSRLHQWLQPDA